MKRKRDPLLWAAQQIQRALADRSAPVFPEHPLERLLERQRAVTHAVARLRRARRRHWLLAAERLRLPLLLHVRALKEDAAAILAWPDRPRQPAVVLGELLAELRQLKAEFEHVEVRHKERILAARTQSIELEAQEFGPFAIELHLERLTHTSLGIDCFDCVALDPHPAATDALVTHPHVRDRALCAGAAAGPIAHAMSDGRIADAFCLIRGVLQTYNHGSPYVAIPEWNGALCSDCGCAAGSDGLNHCSDCESDVCDECYSCCNVCGKSYCQGCLEMDAVSERRCCADCRQICGQCHRTVDRESFDFDSGLCPGCIAKRQQANQRANQCANPASPNPSPENNPHEQQPQTPEPEPTAMPAALAG